MVASADGAPARAARCDCHFARRSAALWAGARIPPRYQHCTLENFVSEGSREHGLALRTAESYSGAFPGGLDVDRKGLLFYGGVGTGKTHLAIAIAGRLLERGIGCRFVDHRALLKQIQATFDPANPATEAGVVQPLLDVEVLILDDLGVGRATEWALETLHYILNDRYSGRLATIITTNLDPGEQAGSESSLARAVGERLCSRLYEMCAFVELKGRDFRRERARPVVR